ncbi:DUF262 domain-containing protein [Bacillus cereus]|uniref:DUF262 domain-containing protein n=1 Tax=Bacillus cereus TaxID=1396 RepID=UPI003B786D98
MYNTTFNNNFIDADTIEIETPEKPENILVEPFDPKKIDITMKPMTLDLLIKRMKEHEINLDTKFQRQHGLWGKIEQSRLIESLLIRIPLPAFYFDGTNDNNWLIVDGLQRLSTLNSFVVNQDLALENLEFLSQFHGLYYKDLPRQMQRRIEETQVTAFIINPGTPSQVKFNIFKRINTGGLTLEPQEIRHALNQGIPADFLEDLANNPDFKKATCNLIKTDRMQDREFVLRFLAFNITPYTLYTPDLDKFLNNAMEILSTLSKEERSQLQLKFEKAMVASYKLFENDAFRKRYNKSDKRKPINKALFETWAVNLGNLPLTDINILTERKNTLIESFIKELNTNKKFENSITTGTSQPNSVRIRFETVIKLIKEVLK